MATPQPPPPKPSWLSAFQALLLAAVYAAAVLARWLPGKPLDSLHTWHPVLGCALLLFLVVAVSWTASIRGPNALTMEQRHPRVKRHFTFIVLASLSLAAAFGAMYLHKERQIAAGVEGIYHNVTLHAKFGLFVAILFAVQAFRPALGYWLTRSLWYDKVKQHRNGGYFITVIVYLTHASAVGQGHTGHVGHEQTALLALLAVSCLALLVGAKRGQGTADTPVFADGYEDVSAATVDAYRSKYQQDKQKAADKAEEKARRKALQQQQKGGGQQQLADTASSSTSNASSSGARGGKAGGKGKQKAA